MSGPFDPDTAAAILADAWRRGPLRKELPGAVRPQTMTQKRQLAYGNGLLKDRMIFGTSYPLQPILRTVAETEALPLKPEVKKMWFYDNAARLLGLPPRPPGA